MSTITQTAVVTGASRGFGRAIAAALVAGGARVVGIARDGDALDAVRAEYGENFVPFAAEAADEAVAQEVIRSHRPGLLVLNAGAVPHMAPVLGIRFVALFPQLTPATGLGTTGVEGYAARQGVDPETFVKGLQPIVTPELVAESVERLAADSGSAAEYRITGDGLHPIG